MLAARSEFVVASTINNLCNNVRILFGASKRCRQDDGLDQISTINFAPRIIVLVASTVITK